MIPDRRLSWLSAVLLTGMLAMPAVAEQIDRVEPPFWWQGFEHDELQILVYGEGIGEFDVAIDYPGVSISRVERVDSDNYVFIYINIEDAANTGSFDIVLQNGDLRVSHEYELREKNSDPSHAKGFTPADVIYMLMPDRFANGDPSNDTVAGLRDGLNRADDRGRHGGDLAGIIEHLDYIAQMGFTAIWLNPVLENAMAKASYHGYATTDFYKVDPRIGSNDLYLELAARAREKGISLIMDMIANHSGSEHWWMRDLPAPDWINFPETHQITSNARTTNQDPYASEYDKAGHTDGWFAETMPDLNQRNSLLADYLIQNSIWWIEHLGLAGIRMDTFPYPDKHFMSEWSRRIMQEYPDFNLTGEEWSANPAIVSYWQRGRQNHDGYVSYMPSMLDFPLQIALRKSLTEDVPTWDSPWTSVYEMLGNDFLYPRPFNLVIFPDNHDMSRIYAQVGEDYDLYRMAIVYYATMRGIPMFYYGTELLMSDSGVGDHGEVRQEFPGGWSDHKKNGFTGEGLSDDELRAQRFMRQLLNWRKEKSVIHTGKLMQYAPIKSVYAYFRYDDEDTVMAIFNQSQDTETLDLNRFAERIGDATRAEDVLTGRRYGLNRPITLEPRSVLLLEVDHK